MNETSKALRRRLRDPIWAERIMVGDAIDIGSGPDSLARQIGIWPLLKSVASWDVEDGDAQELKGVANESFDLVLSSHCLEHVQLPASALYRWFEVVRPGGHLVVTVPDFEMYERKRWPSRFNADHKHHFTLHDVAAITRPLPGDPMKIERITEHFDPSLPKDYDQTQGLAECAIEFIVRKPK